MKKLKLFFGVLVLVAAVGCEAVHELPTEPTDPNPPPTGPLKTKIDFARIKAEVLEPACISCHTDRHAAYANYEIVKASISGIESRVFAQNIDRRMPPKRLAGLSEDQLAMMREWIDAGAPLDATDVPDPTPDPTPDPNPDPDPQPDPNAIGFAEIKTKILKPHCTQCHSHFNDFQTVKESLGSIFSLVNQDKMPFPKKKNDPVVPLSDDLKQMLADWVNDGAPEVGGVKDGPLAPRTLKPTWLSLRNQIFGPKCILCHNGYGPRAPTKFATYKELIQWSGKNQSLFMEDSPNDSHFIGSMLGRVDDDEFFFDPMPFNSTVDDVPTDLSSVSAEEIEVIEKWIELGLPYDEDELPN